MSQLLKKSDDNLKACQLLIDTHKLYTASVHNAYYSALQRSMHVLETHFPTSVVDPTDEGSSHVKTIKALEQKLVDNGYRNDAFDYDQNIGKLKRNRVRADYRVQNFSETQSRECLQLAQDLNNLLDESARKLSIRYPKTS